MLEFLSMYANKAYKEIEQIINNPNFLFSNDPRLIEVEARNNYKYIHGFTRQLKKSSISNKDVIESLFFVESKIEQYLQRFYKDKDFILVIYGDIGIPAFTLTVFSHYNNDNNVDRSELVELVDWFKNNALFNGLEIGEKEIEGEQEQDDFKFKRYYRKIIKT
ncbi:hypothetical protein JNUCC32_12505 [Paenibacillus sp. JNUCC32]|uniref:hypothetical protein n=1 Tax=Paenibacillus sp. JNUCC32 TaxID=2777984 RepID=UPI001788676C|nr:hypothetical protein [Paenibacillus sp. JNUCC-32]QOT12786.1 hypothetical protein JNUCC32_12505 [Paenibacillus sp. JNUCC-32]